LEICPPPKYAHPPFLLKVIKDHLLLKSTPTQQTKIKWWSVCRDDDGGCRGGIVVSVAGDYFGLLEEGTHVSFALLFSEIGSRLL